MKKYASFLIVFALALSLTGVALAQAPGTGIFPTGVTGTNIGQQGPITGTTTLVEKIVGLIQWVAWIVGLLAVLMGLYAGILFITAGGDAAKIEKARGILLYAIVGIVVAIISFGLVAISRAIVGF